MFLLVFLVLAGALFLALWILKAPSSCVQIRNRHILITGGSSGIGLELAKVAAAEGARKLTLIARNEARLTDAKNAVLESLNSATIASTTEVTSISADVVDRSSIQRAICEAGEIDVLVCSHGLSIPCAFEDADEKDVDAVVDINFKGTMNVIKAALPGMVKGGHPRSIAIFSSQAAQAGIYGYTVYSGTKSALVGFAQALKQELFLRNIQVSVIYPPDTDTPGLREENKFKPEITKILSASSKEMEAADVARVALNGIKAGKFTVACNFDGHLLAVACSGMSPQTSAVYATLETVLLPFVRIIALCVQYGWYRTIRVWSSVHKKHT